MSRPEIRQEGTVMDDPIALKTLSHYSNVPNKVFSLDYRVPCDTDHKPGGLWLSDESDFGWAQLVSELERSGRRDWADGGERWKHRRDFKIDPGELAHIRVLKTPDDFRQFEDDYREPRARECTVNGKTEFGFHIEWSRVKSDYKGILITPYQPALSHRNGSSGLHWYRFDCASGCFWNISCLLDANGRRLMKMNRQRQE